MNNNNLNSLNENPIDLFAKWYEEAKKNEVKDPNAMNLSTISKDHKPSSRIVLLKSFSINGFVFYTNTLSKKGNSLENNKYAALNFYWKSLLKQIRIEGEVTKVNDKEADEYFSKNLSMEVIVLNKKEDKSINLVQLNTSTSNEIFRSKIKIIPILNS